jgi:hypothetical protein
MKKQAIILLFVVCLLAETQRNLVAEGAAANTRFLN